MMPDLDKIYDRSFFAEWGRHHALYVATAEKIAAHINDVFKPRRIIDLGCGCGVYSHFFRSFGVEALAVDGVRPPAAEAFPGEILLRDLTEPVTDDWGEFDFTLCFDVAEHIPADLVAPFTGNLARFSRTLVFAAAPPNQGGKHHVNEQPKRYWIERLRRAGMIYDRAKTGAIVEYFKQSKPGYMWMCQHISVYERADI
ncbi:MAG: hypothetical protein ABIJ96_00305 [Elusimicrobiota bacterium]